MIQLYRQVPREYIGQEFYPLTNEDVVYHYNSDTETFEPNHLSENWHNFSEGLYMCTSSGRRTMFLSKLADIGKIDVSVLTALLKHKEKLATELYKLRQSNISANDMVEFICKFIAEKIKDQDRGGTELF